MPAAEGADHRAADQVERGEQAGGAVADVVVTAPLGGAQEHRQDRPEAGKRLDLALLVDTTHDRPLGWIEVQANDVANLLDEEGVGRELEALGVGAAAARRPARSG